MRRNRLSAPALKLAPALLLPLALLLALVACVQTATATEIGGEWHLIGFEGTPAPAPLSISFAASGEFSGQAPCNRFFGRFSGDLPALTLGAIGATKMACPDLAVEAVYFEALGAMTSAEAVDGRLFLIGPEGRVLEFVRNLADREPCLSCR